MNKIAMPLGARTIVQGLRYANYDAYVVGGCVRDSLLGLEPKDWDICTSATPEEMKEYFSRCSVRTIDTGLKHGTITVDMERSGNSTRKQEPCRHFIWMTTSHRNMWK